MSQWKFSTGQPKELTSTDQLHRHRKQPTIRVNTTTGRLLTTRLEFIDGPRIYLIDTGAGINLIKHSKVNSQIYESEPNTFYMGQDKYETNRYVIIRMIGKPNKFYIIPDDFPLIEDGIIGLPCLENYKYEISNDQIKLDDTVLYFQKPTAVNQAKPKFRQSILKANQPEYVSSTLVR